MCIDPTKTYTAAVETNNGDFTVELDPSQAPHTVNNFVVLSRYHYYDGIAVPPDHPGLRRAVRRPDGQRHRRPRLHVRRRAARRRASTSSARWPWPTPGPTPTAASSSSSPATRARSCRRNYSLFGQVTDGFDTTVKAIAAAGEARPQDGGRRSEPVQITKVTITES